MSTNKQKKIVVEHTFCKMGQTYTFLFLQLSFTNVLDMFSFEKKNLKTRVAQRQRQLQQSVQSWWFDIDL